MLTRRRMMMQEKTEEVWDYVFTTYTKTPIPVTAGQMLTIKYAPSTKTNGYIYYTIGGSGVLSPEYQRATAAYQAGGTLTKEVLADGDVYIGTNNAGSSYYMFNGAYIKVRIS